MTAAQVETARRKNFVLFACNDAFRLAPDAVLLHACNYKWWKVRWPEVKGLPAEKWTTNQEAADEFGINWIREKANLSDGLSTDPKILHHGHGSGYQLVGLARHSGARRIVLLGYDMAYAPDYYAAIRQPGSTPRHFFGEYPPELQHWPSRQVVQGVHVELLGIFRATAEHLSETGPEQIINCSGGVMDCFPRMPIEELDAD